MSILNKITQSSQNVINKAKDMGEVSTIKSKITQEQKVLKENVNRLGEMYYHYFKDNPDQRLVEICSIITQNRMNIQSLNEEIEGIQNTLTCPKCSEKQPEGTAFCGSCGESLARVGMKNFCSGCGKQVDGASAFCSNCGTRV